MKKVLICMFTFISSSIYSQEINFGIKGGLNLSNGTFSGADSEYIGKPESKTNFHLGGFLVYNITNKFALQPELLYNRLGFVTKITETAPGYFYNSKNNVSLNYLSIPVMCKFNIYDGLSLDGGPQLGILLNGEQKYVYEETYLGNRNYSEETIDAKKNFKSIDFGLNIGTSYKIENNMVFSLRYYFGLSDLWKEYFDEDFILGYKNKNLQFSVGYIF